MRISDWSSDVCSSDLRYAKKAPDVSDILPTVRSRGVLQPLIVRPNCGPGAFEIVAGSRRWTANGIALAEGIDHGPRSEEHTSELQSLMRISYAVFCLKKKTQLVLSLKPYSTRNRKSNNKS